MAFTSVLGSSDSKPGNIVLGLNAAGGGGGGLSSSIVRGLSLTYGLIEEHSGTVSFSRSKPFAAEVPYPRVSHAVVGSQLGFDGFVLLLKVRAFSVAVSVPTKTQTIIGDQDYEPGMSWIRGVPLSPDNQPRIPMSICYGSVDSSDGSAILVKPRPTANADVTRITTPQVCYGPIVDLLGSSLFIHSDPAIENPNFSARIPQVVIGEILETQGFVIPRANPVQPDIGGIHFSNFKPEESDSARTRETRSSRLSLRTKEPSVSKIRAEIRKQERKRKS